LGNDGTPLRQLFHYWAMLEHEWDSCSIICGCWNIIDVSVPSLGDDGTAERQLFHDDHLAMMEQL
jgi:hypothetical protein